ncbi:uncharacterized protein LOC117111903 isoform X2 [Anneissia japonica]|nr:uncharacterized protein LOC117111903 isoform X2 [Anneissia japonica]
MEQEHLLNQVSPEPAARRNSPKGKNNVQNQRNAGCKLSKATDIPNGNSKHVTVSPGRRCLSDSKIIVKKRHVVSDNHKRKINFVEADVGQVSVVPSKCKRRKSDDGLAVNHRRSSPKFDVNHNCVSYKNTCLSEEKNAGKSRSSEILEYKSCHPIGNRVSVGRITTYSEVVLSDPKRTFTHNTYMTHKTSSSGKKNTKMGNNRKHNGIVQNEKSLSVKEKCVTDNMDGENSNSDKVGSLVTDPPSNESHDDISDVFEAVDNEILFNKSSTSLEMVVDEHSSDKVDTSVENDNKGHITQECKKQAQNSNSESANDSKTNDVPRTGVVKKRRLSQKYADIEPRNRKRRLASLTAETKNYLLYEKDEPLKKSSGVRGRKASKSDAATLSNGFENGITSPHGIRERKGSKSDATMLTNGFENGIANSHFVDDHLTLVPNTTPSKSPGTALGLSTGDGKAKKKNSLSHNAPVAKNRLQNNFGTINSCVVKKFYNNVSDTAPIRGRPGRKPKLTVEKVGKIVRRRSTNGWKGIGQPQERLISTQFDQPPIKKMCYQSIKRKDDIISERDCILLRSGIRREPPFVGKVSALWEDQENGEIMINLLWYYRPEHTETGRRPQHLENELFACKHYDTNSVACVEDKCYVLTLGEYCRYKCQLKMRQEGIKRSRICVPELFEGYHRSGHLPPMDVDPSCVFLCRQVYDFRQKRILKNPQ